MHCHFLSQPPQWLTISVSANSCFQRETEQKRRAKAQAPQSHDYLLVKVFVERQFWYVPHGPLYWSGLGIGVANYKAREMKKPRNLQKLRICRNRNNNRIVTRHDKVFNESGSIYVYARFYYNVYVFYHDFTFSFKNRGKTRSILRNPIFRVFYF